MITRWLALTRLQGDEHQLCNRRRPSPSRDIAD
jgi:hypothetical protein